MILIVRRLLVAALSLFAVSTLSSCVTLSPSSGAGWAESMMEEMTFEERVSQLFAIRANGVFRSRDDENYQDLIDLVENFGAGGVVFFRGEPLNQAFLANDLQARAKTPLLVSADYEWGAGMRLDGTTTFPRAMALGATGDPELARRMGRVIAKEARALGVHQNYAPVADVNNNPDNPVINVRSFGETAELVESMVVAYMQGMQEAGVHATIKHFPGHGDTDVDSHIDIPVLTVDEKRLNELEMRPFAAAIDSGASGVMVAHMAFPALEPDTRIPATLSKAVVTGILRENLGFDGLIVSDALEMKALTKYFDTGEVAIMALEAGIDVLLLSPDPYEARRAIIDAVQSGRLTEARVDESVRRILEMKQDLGLHEKKLIDLSAIPDAVSTDEHQALNDEVAQRSITLLRNENRLIPLPPGGRALIIALGNGSDASLGSSFASALGATSHFDSVTRVLLDRRSTWTDYNRTLARIDDFDAVIVASYVSARSEAGALALDSSQRDLLNQLSEREAVMISFGNPYIASGLKQQDAYVVTYSAPQSSVRAVANAITGRGGFYGKLPVTIPGDFEVGAGITLDPLSLGASDSSTMGMTMDPLSEIDALIEEAIADQAFPAAAIAIGTSEGLVKSKGYGHYTYDSDKAVNERSRFDLASLTKAVATTSAVMALYDDKRLDLDAPVADYLPEFAVNGKEAVTVRHLLTHTSGLPAYRFFHAEGITSSDEVRSGIMESKLKAQPGKKYTYSDFGMIVLALAVENITKTPIEDLLKSRVWEPLGMSDTGFLPARQHDHVAQIVPTEIDNGFRKRLVQGEVHDETAWLLGGVAGHAGLFSTAADLATFCQMLLNEGKANGKQLFQPETVRLFTQAQNPSRHDRALGWDTKAIEGYSSAGSRMKAGSFGHTGFTGTSLWIDPASDAYVILLTNRVYPTRNNKKHIPIRPALADLSMKALGH